MDKVRHFSTLNISRKDRQIVVKETFTITSETGLHARPATLLVNKAGQYQSDIQLTYENKTVDLKSIMAVMSLGVPSNATVEIQTDGEDEEEAMKGISIVIHEHLKK